MDGIKLPPQVQQNIFQVLTRVLAERLNAGDVLEGRVMSLENSMLLLKLLDGTSLTCKVPDNFNARPNDLITLEIGEPINGRPTARIISLSDGISNQDAIFLSGNSSAKEGRINADSALINDITQQLLSFDIKPDSRNITDVLGLLKDIPDLSTREAAFISANGLNSDIEMLKVFEKISQHEYNLNENLLNLKNGLMDIISGMDNSARSEILTPQIISREINDLSALLERELAQFPDSVKDSVVSNISGTLTKILLDEMQNGRSITGLKTDVENLMKNILNSIRNSDAFIDGQVGEKEAAINPKIQDNILKLINKTLEEIHTRAQKAESGDLKEIEALLDRMLDKAILKIEKGVPEDSSIKVKMKALEDVMKFSEKVLNQAGNNTNTLPEFREINQVLRFFSQINTYNLVMHVPLKINNSSTDGELYIMKRRGRKKKVDENNFTLLISLTTQALGLIESFINSTNKCVTISFRVEKEELINLIKENYRVLYDRLLDKGYKLADMKCRLLEKPRTNIVNTETEAEKILGLKSKVDLII